MGVCKHCGKGFDISEKPKGWMANHTRWCSENPKSKIHKDNMIFARSCIKEHSNQHIKAKKIGSGGFLVSKETRLKLSIAGSKRKHTKESIEKMSVSARLSKHRRLRKKMIEYKGIMLDSSWELALAKRLDKLGVLWVRPEPLVYFDRQGKERHYFPDFFLPEYNTFLDPKNPQAYKVQKEKIDLLNEQFSNIFFIRTLSDVEKYTP